MMVAGVGLPDEIVIARVGRYRNGYRYCKKCELYFKTSSIRCPICRNILRAKPKKRPKNRKPSHPMITPPEEIRREAEKIGVVVKR